MILPQSLCGDSTLDTGLCWFIMVYYISAALPVLVYTGLYHFIQVYTGVFPTGPLRFLLPVFAVMAAAAEAARARLYGSSPSLRVSVVAQP